MRRFGSVWCRWFGEGAGTPHWSCYWDREPDGKPACLDAARLPDLATALAWGRERAPAIYVYPVDDEENGGEPYWAGEGPPPDDLVPLPGNDR